MEEEEQPKKKRGGFANNPELASRAGKKGAAVLREERGREHFVEMGAKGGAAMKAKHGRSYYREIGKAGANLRWARVRAEREAERGA